MAELVKDKATVEVSAESKSELMEVVQAMHKLTLEEKAQLLEYLGRSIQHGIKQEAYKDISWEEFINMTYGSLANDPIELPERFKAHAQDSSQ